MLQRFPRLIYIFWHTVHFSIDVVYHSLLFAFSGSKINVRKYKMIAYYYIDITWSFYIHNPIIKQCEFRATFSLYSLINWETRWIHCTVGFELMDSIKENQGKFSVTVRLPLFFITILHFQFSPDLTEPRNEWPLSDDKTLLVTLILPFQLCIFVDSTFAVCWKWRLEKKSSAKP